MLIRPVFTHGLKSVAQSIMVEKYTEILRIGGSFDGCYYIAFSIESHVFAHISGAASVAKM